MEKKFNQRFNDATNQAQKQKKKDGQVIINQNEKRKKVDKNVGDYVDFEEEN
jgi:hypothetical protein